MSGRIRIIRTGGKIDLPVETEIERSRAGRGPESESGDQYRSCGELIGVHRGLRLDGKESIGWKGGVIVSSSCRVCAGHDNCAGACKSDRTECAGQRENWRKSYVVHQECFSPTCWFVRHA